MLQKLLPKQKVSMSSDLPTCYELIGTTLPVKNIDTLQQMGGVMSVLSKYDALSIFVLTKNGLKSELDTPQKIGLTKKQYYTRLKQLYDLNLITKDNNSYVHTTFGSIIYEKHIVGLANNIVNIKELEMIDVLKKSSKFKPEEIVSFVSKLSPEMNAGTFLESRRGRFEMTRTFDAMVRKVIEIIEFAEREILLVTRFPNELIINAILKKAERGVQTKIISDVDMVEGYFQSEKDKVGISDKNSKERINVVANPFYPSRIERRYSKAPYCMLIVDQTQTGLEIVDNNNPRKFKMAMFVADEETASEIKAEFEHLWQEATVNHPQIKEAY